MTNTTRKTTTLQTALIAGAVALTSMSSLHAQVLGRGSLGGGLAGGLGGPMQSVTGQLGGGAHGMGGLDASGFPATRPQFRAERLRRHAASAATSATDAVRSRAGSTSDALQSRARQANGSAAGNAAGDLAGAADAHRGDTALQGAGGLTSTATGNLDAGTSRAVATGAANPASDGTATVQHGALDGLRNEAQDASGSAKSRTATQGNAAGALASRRPGHAAGGKSRSDGARSSSHPAGPRATTRSPDAHAQSRPRLLPQASGATRGSRNTSLDLSGSGAADGQAKAGRGNGAASRMSGSAHADGDAHAHGSPRNGVSTSARADGGADAQANALTQ